MQIPIHERAADAGVYQLMDTSFFVDDQIDPAIVKEIRSFEPYYVPLLVKRLYRTPAGTAHYAQWHCIGRYIPDPQDGYEHATVKLEHVPPGFPFDPKKIHELRTLCAPWPSGSTEYRLGVPPAYVKPGRWLVEQMRALNKALDIGVSLETNEEGELQQRQKETMQDKLNEILRAESERDEKIQADAMDEARQAMKENWRFFKEAAEKERWLPEPPDAAPKPFVDLKGKP